jgi:muramoyltetrapeptide carboxypeptidase
MDRKHRIYIYSPSGAVRDKAAFRRGLRFLQKNGCDVEVDVGALSSHQRFAGDDQMRIDAIARAAASGADIALISRGGYGLTRILNELPYEALAQAIDEGTQFVGFSDFTALQLGLLSKTGRSTWAGPALCEGFGASEPDDIMVDCFFDVVNRQGEGVGWRLPKAMDTFNVTSAMLWGGNLTTLCSLLGTPFFPTIDGGILFIEDVGEHPYRIERQLTQLLHAGVLSRQQAIVFGQFSDYKLTAHDRGFKIQSVVEWLQKRLDTPLFTNLPFGHVPTKVMLPVGRTVDMSIDGRDALIVWGDV